MPEFMRVGRPAIESLRLNARAIRGAKDRPGGPIVRDLNELLPAFRLQVQALLRDMVLMGHDPIVWETWRSPERVAMLVQRGTGSRQSMHPLRIAVDIIERNAKWNAPRKFWMDLVDLAEVRGLTSGAHLARHDLPHVQAVPFNRQVMFMATAAAERDSFTTDFWMLQPSQSAVAPKVGA